MRTLTALLVVLTLAACTAGGDSNPSAAISDQPVSDPVITIEDMEFKNGSITVEAGTTVTWEWNDGSMPHNVVFDDFESPLQTEGTFTHTFHDPGTYDYHCTPHPFMVGTIVVVEAAGA